MRLKALATGFIMMLAGVAGAQTEVVLWDFLSGGDGVRMQAMIDEFNATHPDIQINKTTLEWGTPFYTKVQTSAAVGEGPDLMTYHLSRYPLGVETGVLRPISDEELAAAGIDTAAFQPGLIDAATFDDQLYGIPFDVHAIILYYNREILSEAGLIGEDGEPQGLDGIENFNQALAAIAETGATPLCFGNSADAGTIWRVFYTLIKQQGGDVIADGQVDVGEAGQVALQTMVDWAEQGYIPRNMTYESSVASFVGGDCAMMFNGVWEVPTMVDQAAQGALFDWGATVIPTLFDQPATWADSHTFAIPQGPDEADPEKVAAALAVVDWMNENSIMWASAGHIPAYTPVTESAEYQEMEPNATYAALAENTVVDPRSTIAGVASPLYDAVGNYLEPSINGQLPPDQALQMFTDDLQSQMR